MNLHMSSFKLAIFLLKNGFTISKMYLAQFGLKLDIVGAVIILCLVWFLRLYNQ